MTKPILFFVWIWHRKTSILIKFFTKVVIETSVLIIYSWQETCTSNAWTTNWGWIFIILQQYIGQSLKWIWQMRFKMLTLLHFSHCSEYLYYFPCKRFFIKLNKTVVLPRQFAAHQFNQFKCKFIIKCFLLSGSKTTIYWHFNLFSKYFKIKFLYF